jgi:AraC-like DNA-binding protein
MERARSIDGTRQAVRPTVWVRPIAAFVARARVLDIDRGALLRAIHLEECDLADPDARLPLECLYDLVEACAALSGDRFAPLRLATGYGFESLDALAFVVMTSPTLGAGIRAMVRFQRVFAEGERYEIEEEAEWTAIVYHPFGKPRPAHSFMAEMFAADILVNGSAMIGASFDRPRVELAHPAPQDAGRLRAALGDPQLRFERPRNLCRVRTNDLARRIAPDGQAAIYEYFARHLDERLRALSGASIAGKVRDLLLRIGVHDPSIPTVAKELRVSARTLQRRLAAEGTSLRALARETRRARAIQMLEDHVPIAEVAYVLGYAEPSAFHRAFRSWTGRTPESFRRSRASVDRSS